MPARQRKSRRESLKRIEFVTPICIFLVALAVRLWHLGKQSLWMDESFSLWMASHSIPKIFEALRQDTHPPLFYLFLHAWLPLGRTEFMVRLPFALMGALNAFLVYRIGMICCDRRTAGLAAFFWATSFVALNSETQARMYAMAVCLSLSATWAFLEAYRKRRLLEWLVYLMLASAALYTHYYTGFVFLAHLIFLFLRRRSKEGAALSIGLVVVMLPWSGFLMAQMGNGVAQGMISLQKHDLFLFSKLLGTYQFIHVVWVNALVSALALGVISWGQKTLFDSKSEFGFFPLLLLITPLLLPLGVSLLTPYHIFLFRYAILFAPYFAFIFFRGISVFPRSVSFPLGVALLGINLVLSYFFLTAPAFERENWREASRYLQIGLRPGDSIFLEQVSSVFPIWYYLDFRTGRNPNPLSLDRIEVGKVKPLTWWDVGADAPPFLLKRITRSSKRHWLVMCQAWFVDPQKHVLNWFKDHEKVVKQVQFRGMEPSDNIYVLLFEP